MCTKNENPIEHPIDHAKQNGRISVQIYRCGRYAKQMHLQLRLPELIPKNKDWKGKIDWKKDFEWYVISHASLEVGGIEKDSYLSGQRCDRIPQLTELEKSDGYVCIPLLFDVCTDNSNELELDGYYDARIKIDFAGIKDLVDCTDDDQNIDSVFGSLVYEDAALFVTYVGDIVSDW